MNLQSYLEVKGFLMQHLRYRLTATNLQADPKT